MKVWEGCNIVLSWVCAFCGEPRNCMCSLAVDMDTLGHVTLAIFPELGFKEWTYMCCQENESQSSQGEGKDSTISSIRKDFKPPCLRGFTEKSVGVGGWPDWNQSTHRGTSLASPDLGQHDIFLSPWQDDWNRQVRSLKHFFLTLKCRAFRPWPTGSIVWRPPVTLGVVAQCSCYQNLLTSKWLRSREKRYVGSHYPFQRTTPIC